MSSLKLAQGLSHLSHQVLLLMLAELPHHLSSQSACRRVQERIERCVMGLKWQSTGADLVKACFGQFLLKDSRVGESKRMGSMRGRSSRML